ncbi:RepB family DNA primase [Methylobacterium sp. J-088]|uniref:DNA-primase RepB domain-containing protein n=1 Tax=Methylobacterium sp. J-088 TaxID=2836664 RepID=UPI001FB890DD|nr:DNA-primase RepB domain-containing protein [Methylobacterium sp. J-088]MCJ2065189.1 RepB family DNA primase [Methylobacterium sp. J-088]
MNAQAPLVADRAVVRTFVERIHAHAAAAFAGIHQPGMLQLVRIHPATEDTLPFRFAIGEVDLMADEAVRQANAGNNVYIEARTVAKNAAKRGSIADTVGVFGLVNDADADKGRAGHLAVEPSLVVETSPGNFHHWLLLDRAVPAAQAKALGAAIRAQAGADAASGVLTQPYRIPGTPNFPGKRKLARGRIATQTGIVRLDGKVWTTSELRAAFPEPERPTRPTGTTAGETGPTGRTSTAAEAIAAETGAPDRSERFFDAVKAAYADGLSPDDLDEVLRRHPDGCAGKYLEPYDRLRPEIDRAWEKVSQKAEEIRQAAERPAYEDASNPIEDARRAVAAAVQRFIDAATAYRLSGDDEAEPPVHGLAVTTGVGKTSATAKALAAHILSRRGTVQATKGILYAVPTHRLGAEIERQFIEHGVTARVFRGRQAPDPDRSGQAMCDDLEAVEIALALGEPVEAACCRHKPKGMPEQVCAHFHTCAYQAQKKRKPDVWIVAHQMLFKAQPALGDIEMVVVDEGFWQSGLRIPKHGLTLDEIRAHLPLGKAREDGLQNDIEHFRGQLARALLAQDGSDGPGGVRREHLLRAGLTSEICTNAINAEWKLKERAPVYPGMPKAERRRAAEAARHAKHVRSYTSMWNAARGILYDEEIEVSGRLYIERRDEDDEGHVLVAKARGLKTIAKAWRAPTMILDATLPAPEILRAFFEQVEIPAPVEAAMPHVHVRQVLGAPVASHKLRPAEGETDNRNLRAVRRAVLARFIQNDRAPLLVIAQKAAADWLRGSGLPEGVAVEHFNNVAGLDRYRDVRGLMVVGRTIPSPAAVEALAGALTAREATIVPKGEWYGKVVRGLRTRDGRPAGIECDAHPDPVAEACRWQICEGEMLQAIGRARGVNRTPETPLSIDVLANVCLPLTVDEVTNWSPPGEEFEMLADGVVLDSGDDMAMAWPDLWGTGQAARNWAHRRAATRSHSVADPYKNSFYIGIRNAVAFRYQRPGPRQKWRTGAYDPTTVLVVRV